ncbi:MAG: YIP1 family protein [Nitrosopumilus sp.]|nr:YIP1 family protein [Nitrosopumilus sp.]MDH3489255.1 YIP1 family protein [Nitrosopumilus sp.]MDH3516254.1 YIP1 family protein [Nitrosopumilus sp.]MDH3564019.1 YIP1 family protein [Nitrosopumilus sp.]MDH5417573.1 YIP1 family protein [Nitrosopumilus sp.]
MSFSFDLNVFLQVITAPNSAFAQIRDNEERYFASSIGVFLIASVIGLLVIAPFVMMPLDDAYYETFEENDIDVDIPTSGSDIVLFVGISIITGIISNVLFYFIGKKLGGNTNWKKVFSVMFYAYVPVIPMMIVISVLVFLMWGSLVAIEPSYLMSSDASDDEILSLVMPVLGYASLLVLVAIVFVVWIFIVSIKGLKIVSGFSTAKAFGLVILVMIISSLVTAPLGM